MFIENMLVRQHRIEILYETPIAVVSTEIITPRFQAEREQVCQ